jgi:uncharacterized membrane protein
VTVGELEARVTAEQSERQHTGPLARLKAHPAHPAIVAVPIGAWIGSFAFDVASRVVDEPDFLNRGSRWLIAIGVLGALAAAIPGFVDLINIPAGSRAQRLAIVHMSMNLTATAGYAVGWVLRGEQSTGPVGIGALLLSLGCLLLISIAGFLGGELVYHYGVRVTGAPEPPHPKEHA